MSSELVGAGLPMLLPDGTTIKYILENYIREKENKMGYEHVATPSLATTELYKISEQQQNYTKFQVTGITIKMICSLL